MSDSSPRTLVLGGNGAIGGSLVELLVARGDAVTVGSRSGARIAGADSIAVDASDETALTRAAERADRIVVCTNPPYDCWAEDWPPIAEAVAAAAARTGDDVILMGNLYAYGEGSRMPMTEDLPLNPTEPKARVRRDVFERLLSASREHDFRFAEVRASDYFGPRCPPGMHLGPAFFTAALRGRTARVIGSTTQPHSWAFLPDIALTLAAAADHTGPWGRAWHVPTAGPLSRVELMQRLDAITGKRGRVASAPLPVLRAAASFSPLLRAVLTSTYQFAAPFVSDSSETERLLAVTATPWDVSLAATLDAVRHRDASRHHDAVRH
jgi:nucleoside-diphosphate-sugar epimerase